jgi:hypothetical protein
VVRECVKISVESYLLLLILELISAESCSLATKVTLKIIHLLFWQKISIESSGLPKKSVEITMAKFPRDRGMGTNAKGQGTMDIGHGTRDMGQGTRDKGQGTRDSGQQVSDIDMDSGRDTNADSGTDANRDKQH